VGVSGEGGEWQAHGDDIAEECAAVTVDIDGDAVWIGSARILTVG